MHYSIPAGRAPVRPRAISREFGETVLLEDAVGAVIDCANHGVVWILGGSGSGKTTALSHLAAVLPPSVAVELADGAPAEEVIALGSQRLVISTASRLEDHQSVAPAIASFRLARWHADEWIEYLLNTHPTRCASVMQRLGNDPDPSALLGLPELWRLALDAMADDEQIETAADAIDCRLSDCLSDKKKRLTAAVFSLDLLAATADAAELILQKMSDAGYTRELLRLIRHQPIQVLLAADGIKESLRSPGPLDCLVRWLPPMLVQRVAPSIDDPVRLRLESIIADGEEDKQAMAASLLFASDRSWRPSGTRLHLSGGYYAEARWDGVDLSGSTLLSTDLRSADLSSAKLLETNLELACLSGADLRSALLHDCRAVRADFSGADLRLCQAHQIQFDEANLANARLEGALLSEASLHGADLTGADLRHANLTGAWLTETELANADLRDACCAETDFRFSNVQEARLSGAMLSRANLSECRLESMDLTNADLRGARLTGALLTGSRARDVCFVGAILCGAALAEIDWEGADLRKADLRGSTFHLGSSRSGLVGSPIASEGGRTGFYTDEYDEQDFKPPEAIRKANLCRADLRESHIEDVDFYLVDLRGALYTRSQESHFRRCGAILEDRSR